MDGGYTREEVQSMLNSLERQAEEVIRLSHRAQAGFAGHVYLDYTHFREKVSEFEVFSMIVEHRVNNLRGGHDPALAEKLDLLNATILNHLIAASIQFFMLLSEGDLPLGSREVFVSELRSMFQAREMLNSGRYTGMINSEAQHNLDVAEKILHEIIERAPGLLRFS